MLLEPNPDRLRIILRTVAVRDPFRHRILPRRRLLARESRPETKIPATRGGSRLRLLDVSPIVPVSGLALAPCWRSQVAGRSTGQNPRASLDTDRILSEVSTSSPLDVTGRPHPSPGRRSVSAISAASSDRLAAKQPCRRRNICAYFPEHTAGPKLIRFDTKDTLCYHGCQMESVVILHVRNGRGREENQVSLGAPNSPDLRETAERGPDPQETQGGARQDVDRRVPGFPRRTCRTSPPPTKPPRIKGLLQSPLRETVEQSTRSSTCPSSLIRACVRTSPGEKANDGPR